MKILHTSDWHIGRSLYGRKRYDEFAAFLEWLSDIVVSHNVDALLVAGDIFDTSTPSNRAQTLYYRVLCKVADSGCRNIVIIAGNHDSPSFLNAPQELLRALNVYVVGSITERPEDEIIILKNEKNVPEAIVCAVPFLRDKDVRMVEPGETVEGKNEKLIAGFRNHYSEVINIAEGKRQEAGDIPVIAMGHLFTAGGKTVDGDGVRELYVGTLAHIGVDVFPASIDYLALGHLHVPQCVGNSEHIRYSGSPIPMGYGEADQEKKVVLVEFKDRKPAIQEIPVPCFQKLLRIEGALEDIQHKIEKLKRVESDAWLEIEYSGADIIADLRELIDEALNGSAMEVRRIKNKRVTDRVMTRINEDITLDDLNENDVFKLFLDSFDIPCEQRPELMTAYKEIVNSLREEDQNAE